MEIKTKIGDVEVEYNFLVQNFVTYIVILEKSYILDMKMETKILDYDSCYVRLRNSDRKKLV